jgi:hypothetical protein
MEHFTELPDPEAPGKLSSAGLKRRLGRNECRVRRGRVDGYRRLALDLCGVLVVGSLHGRTAGVAHSHAFTNWQ